ncbi:MAG: hypothetical protein LBP92_08065 [Deltaproteobacteria bacterium]|jgi:hypothetical protein|nr:hypothetical protein [Deltaproteobacteria bacterium]
MGLSAGLNHFNDISLTPKYAGICGFSRDEFEGFFREQLAVALDSMRGQDPVSADATVAYKTCIIPFGERLMHGP